MLRKYRNVGLRRDFNLRDLKDKEKSLNNILDDLAFSGETFDSNDLFIGIKSEETSLGKTNITFEDLSALVGTTKRTINDFGSFETLKPIVTIKDEIQNFKLISGEIPWIAGGQGLLAKFIPSNAINVGTKSSTGDTIYGDSDDIIGPVYFWNSGAFYIEGPLDFSFQDNRGMIQWEGYYSPGPQNNNNDINLLTNGLFIAEIADQYTDIGWKTIKSFYDEERKIDLDVPVTSNNDVSSIVLSEENFKYVCENDKVLKINEGDINEVDFSNNEVFITIIDTDTETNTITFSEPLNYSNNINSITLYFETFNSIDDFASVRFRLPKMPIGEKMKVRFTSWWNKESTETKYIDYNHTYNGGHRIPYPFFYTNFLEDFQFNKESINFFYNNHIQPKNTKTNADIKVNNSLEVDYNPPLSIDEKVSGPGYLTHAGFGRFVSDIEIFENSKFAKGDYILVDNGLDKYVFQIEQILDTNEVFVEIEEGYGNIPNFANNEFYVIKSEGIVGIYETIDQFNSGNFNVFNIDSSKFSYKDIRNDQLIGTFGEENFLRIFSSEITLTNTLIKVDDFQQESSNTASNISSDGVVFVYESKGLNDQSKDAFCRGVIGKLLKKSVNEGDYILKLSDVNDLKRNMVVQFNDAFKENAQITSVNEVTNEVTISSFVKPGKIIPVDSTITFVPLSNSKDSDGNFVNKENCILPLNIAPPFVSTSSGLQTPEDAKRLRIGNTLSFESLILSIDANNIFEIQDFNSFETNEELQFSYDGQLFRFLIK